MTRRKFTLGAVAAATLTARNASAAPSVNERIPVAVIGCRNRGNQVAANCLNSGQFDVTALCDCDTAMQAVAMSKLEKILPHLPRLERDFRRILDDKNTAAVIIATPDHWHALMTAMALDAGKHVYVEKPASFNIRDGQAMVAAQARHPRQVVLVGTQQRSGQHFKEAKAFVTTGALGKVAFARAWILLDRGTMESLPDSRPPETLDYDMWIGPAAMRPYNEKKLHYNWHFMKDYGTGDMGNWGAHWLDTLRYLLDLDLPSSVCALGGRYVHRDAREWPDTQTVLYEFPDLTVLWELRQWTHGTIGGSGNGAELCGDKGTLTISRAGWTFAPRSGKAEKHPGAEIELVHAVNFAETIRGQAKPAASMIDGHKSATMVHLGNIAATLNRRLECDVKTGTIRNDAEAARLEGREYRAPWKMPT